jgi:hypothetical protein
VPILAETSADYGLQTLVIPTPSKYGLPTDGRLPALEAVSIRTFSKRTQEGQSRAIHARSGGVKSRRGDLERRRLVSPQ